MTVPPWPPGGGSTEDPTVIRHGQVPNWPPAPPPTAPLPPFTATGGWPPGPAASAPPPQKKPYLRWLAIVFATILVGAGIGIGASFVVKRSRGGGTESGTQTPVPQASYTRLTSAIPTAEPKQPQNTDPSGTPAPPGSDKPAPTGEPGPVPKSAVGGLLLAPAAINTIMGATDMVSGSQMDAPFSSLRFSPKECGGLYTPGEDSTYRWGSQHYTALSLQGVHEDTQPRQHLVVQSVATYQDAATAQQFKSTQEAAWTACANRTITVRFDDGKSEKAVAGTPGADQDVLTQTVTNPYAGDGMTCQRAITTKSNVVIDVRACSKNITDQAVQLVRAITEKIT